MAKRKKEEAVSAVSDEMLMQAALTVLRLGAPAGSPLAALAAQHAPTVVAKPASEPPRKTWVAKNHVFSPKWKKTEHTCPKCGFKGMVDPHFGLRLVRGVERLQSWCANCRSTTNYHAMTRLKDRK